MPVISLSQPQNNPHVSHKGRQLGRQQRTAPALNAPALNTIPPVFCVFLNGSTLPRPALLVFLCGAVAPLLSSLLLSSPQSRFFSSAPSTPLRFPRQLYSSSLSLFPSHSHANRETPPCTHIRSSHTGSSRACLPPLPCKSLAYCHRGPLNAFLTHGGVSTGAQIRVCVLYPSMASQ